MHIRSLLLGSIAAAFMPMFSIADEGGSADAEAIPAADIGNVEGDVNITKPATDATSEDVTGSDEDGGEEADKDDEEVLDNDDDGDDEDESTDSDD